jgi:hypothetical protein
MTKFKPEGPKATEVMAVQALPGINASVDGPLVVRIALDR